MLKVTDLKAGQKFSAIHSRKGMITGIVHTNEKDSEWLDCYLLEKVEGLVNEWNQGELLTCRKSFLSSIKLLEESSKKEKIIFPIEVWGKDHWSMLAYCECQAVDYRGVLDLCRIRVNQDKRGFSNGNFPHEKWNPEHATRKKDGGKPDKTHDDIDVLDDLQRENFLTYTYKYGKFTVTLTKHGEIVCALLRQHKSSGKQFNEFCLDKELTAE